VGLFYFGIAPILKIICPSYGIGVAVFFRLLDCIVRSTQNEFLSIQNDLLTMQNELRSIKSDFLRVQNEILMMQRELLRVENERRIRVIESFPVKSFMRLV